MRNLALWFVCLKHFQTSRAPEAALALGAAEVPAAGTRSPGGLRASHEGKAEGRGSDMASGGPFQKTKVPAPCHLRGSCQPCSAQAIRVQRSHRAAPWDGATQQSWRGTQSSTQGDTRHSTQRGTWHSTQHSSTMA